MTVNFPKILRDASDYLTEDNWIQEKFLQIEYRPGLRFKTNSTDYLGDPDKICGVCALGAIALTLRKSGLSLEETNWQISQIIRDIHDLRVSGPILHGASLPQINDEAKNVQAVKQILLSLADRMEHVHGA